eukprot:15447125-Alexandrium_andersonii.AAC.1
MALSLALKRKGPKLAPKPATEVSTSETVFQRDLDRNKSNDLGGLWSPMATQNSWKQEPRASLIDAHHSLLLDIVRASPECILSHGKVVSALLAAHQARPCLFGKMGPEVSAVRLSGILRALLAKVRALFSDQRQRSITLAKARR